MYEQGKKMRMRVVAGAIIAVALLLSTRFGGAVCGGKMRDELHKSVNEINKKALKKQYVIKNRAQHFMIWSFSPHIIFVK